MLLPDRTYALRLRHAAKAAAMAALLAFAALACGGCGAAPAQSGPAEPPSPKLIALTFDDGPSPFTGMLLDGLAERGVPATFFMTGENGTGGVAGIENGHEDLLPRMWEEGHQLANHSYSHARLDELPPEGIQAEVSRTEDLIFDACGGTFTCFVRTSGGHYNESIRENVHSPVIGWSLDTRDWETRDADHVYKAIVGNAKDGDIVLLHDLYETSVEGAFRAIDALQEEGFEFVTVAELLRRTGTAPLEGSKTSVASRNGPLLEAYEAPGVEIVRADGESATATCEGAPGLELHYTLDGSYPTLSSPELTGPVAIGAGDVLTVIGVDPWGTRTPESRITL